MDLNKMAYLSESLNEVIQEHITDGLSIDDTKTVLKELSDSLSD